MSQILAETVFIVLMDDIDQQDGTLQRRSYELSVLNDVARALNASVDLPTLLERALEKVTELLDLHTGWVLLFDEATGEPHLAAAQNLPPGLAQEPDRMEGGCHCLKSFCAGNLHGAANVGVVTCSRLRKLALAQGDTAGLRFHASVPLAVCVGDAALGNTTPDDILQKAEQGQEVEGESGEAPCATFKRLGMLNVASPEWRQLTDDELNLLHTIGDMLGVAVERARLHARRLEAAQTEERNRLAREVHDTIAQDFSAIAFQLETTEALLEQRAAPERIQEGITAALGLTRKGLEEARRSVLDLRAAPLEGHTLSEALATLAEEMSAREGASETEEGTASSPAVAFSQASAKRSLPPAVEVGLYRIAQEALQNALRHADADRITLCLEIAPDETRLTVEDDGRGFDVDSVAESGASDRFGLVGMRERVHLLGGALRIDSTPGVGTRITAEVPLSP